MDPVQCSEVRFLSAAHCLTLLLWSLCCALQCYLSRTIVRQIGLDPATVKGTSITSTIALVDLLGTLGFLDTNSNTQITAQNAR